jgi:hypothetical protein
MAILSVLYLSANWVLACGTADSRTPHFSRVTDAGAIVTDSVLSAGGSWADYDNDGLLDVYLAQSVRGRGALINALYRNLGPPLYAMERRSPL